MLRLALLSGTALVALSSSARADPISLIAAGVNAVIAAGGIGTTVATIGATTITIGQIVGVAVVAGGAIAASFLTSPGKKTIDPGQAKEQFENAETPELRAVGRVRLGGLKAFGNVQEFDRYRLIFHCKGPIDAVEEYWLGNREVTLNEDGGVSSPPYARVGTASWIYLFERPGTGDELAWTYLKTAFPSLWTDEHRARGICQTLIKYISPGVDDPKYLKLYGSGLPELQKVIRAERVYDPRIDATVWSDNGILCALHVALSFPGFTLDDFDLDYIAVQADKADTLVPSRAGNERLSRCSGVWTSETARGETLKQVLDSVGAEQVIGNNDKIAFRIIDDERAAETHIPEKHIIDLKWKSGPEGVERPNVCIVKYYSAERNYELTEIDLSGLAWARIDSEIALVGEKAVTFEFPFCPSAAQAQRIARRMFAVSRSGTGTLTTNMVGLSAWGLRGISIEFPDLGISPVCQIGPPRPDDQNGTVEIPFTVWPELATYNPDFHEVPAPAPLPSLDFSSGVAVPDRPGPMLVVTFPGGATEIRAAIYPPPGAYISETTFRTYPGGLRTTWKNMFEVSGTGLEYAYQAGGSVGLLTDVRSRVFTDEEEGSAWSPVYQAALVEDNTPPAAPEFSGDINEDLDSPDYGNLTLTAMPAPNLQIATIRFTATIGGIPVTSGHLQARPGQPVTYERVFSGADETWTATPYTSNGTAGTPVTITVIAPGGA